MGPSRASLCSRLSKDHDAWEEAHPSASGSASPEARAACQAYCNSNFEVQRMQSKRSADPFDQAETYYGRAARSHRQAWEAFVADMGVAVAEVAFSKLRLEHMGLKRRTAIAPTLREVFCTFFSTWSLDFAKYLASAAVRRNERLRVCLQLRGNSGLRISPHARRRSLRVSSRLRLMRIWRRG